MSREIKFRGKRLGTGEWIYGSLLQQKVNGIHTEMILIDRGFAIDQLQIEAMTAGQFTGLKDQNGKEIYEGDIVRYYDDIEDERVDGFVRYEADLCSFCIIPINPSERFGLTAFWKVEVIGNRNDNPSLLKND